MTIDNIEYSANLAVLDGTATATFPTVLEYDDIRTLMGAQTAVDGENSYNLSGFTQVRIENSSTVIKWTVEDATEAQLSAANSKLTAITDAITALGDGVPTLAKLKTFLTAVKEAVSYESD